MHDQGQLYFATNKEIHDLLYSAKLRITESVLHELLRDRGIFYSLNESREVLVERLSLLPHDYLDICGVIERREQKPRGEKTATVTFDVVLSPQDLKDIIAEYKEEETKEKVGSFKKSESEYTMNVTYSEYDYSKTRLIQRQERDAAFEFVQQNGRTEVRLPATEKARSIVEKIRVKIEAKKKQVVSANEIELTDLSADDRTSFFMKLISSLPHFPMLTVSRLRVAHADIPDADSGIDLEEDDTAAEAAQQMLSVVRNVALTGENLVASPMYKDLREQGFYVTSITWRARQDVIPFTIVECDAGFEDKQAAKKFRYSVHGALRFKNAAYTKNLQSVNDGERAAVLAMIEQTARIVLATIKAEGEKP
jgi:hypothetical protein